MMVVMFLFLFIHSLLLLFDQQELFVSLTTSLSSFQSNLHRCSSSMQRICTSRCSNRMVMIILLSLLLLYALLLQSCKACGFTRRARHFFSSGWWGCGEIHRCKMGCISFPAFLLCLNQTKRLPIFIQSSLFTLKFSKQVFF